jgi:hypothetical protein
MAASYGERAKSEFGIPPLGAEALGRPGMRFWAVELVGKPSPRKARQLPPYRPQGRYRRTSDSTREQPALNRRRCTALSSWCVGGICFIVVFF